MREKEIIFFFTGLFFPSLLQLSFPFISCPVLSFLPSLFLLSALLFSSIPSCSLAFLLSPPPCACYEQELGRKYVGFSHSSAGPDPTPHPLIFCPSLHSFCLMSEGSLEENHPYSTTKYSGCLLELYAARCSTDINCALLWRQDNQKKVI